MPVKKSQSGDANTFSDTQSILTQGQVDTCIVIEIDTRRRVTGLSGLGISPGAIGADALAVLQQEFDVPPAWAKALVLGALEGRAGRAILAHPAGEIEVTLAATPRVDAHGGPGAAVTLSRAHGVAPAHGCDAQDRLNAILDNAADAILVINTEGVIENANRATAALSEWPAEMLIGQPLTVLMGADEQDHQERVTRYLETGKSGILNVGPRPLTMITRSGATVPIELSVGEARVGGAIKFVGICRDIRERLQVEAALRVANERLHGQVDELRALGRDLEERKRALQALTSEAQAALRVAEHANQAKSRFIATMSHELRTPLNGVLAIAEALSKRALPADALELAELIKSSGQGLLSILNEVLDLATVEAGALALDVAAISPSEAVSAVMDVWRFAAEAKGLTLTLGMANLPPFVMADAKRLRQILSNLVSNAIKFTDRGAVHLSAIGGPEPGRLRFSIIDSGPGIKPHQREKLFEPFVQADAGATRRHGGTGLGLTICRELITLMGGRIWAEAAPTGGTAMMVDVTLPLASAPEAPVTDPSVVEVLPPIAANFDPLILVAEDHPLNRRVIAILLDEAGLRYEFAEDGEAAVEAAASGRFDLILMDVHMPQLDGLAATRRIRAFTDARGSIPIIAVTANAAGEEIAACRAAGMDDFVGKPISAEALFSAIVRLARV